MTATPDSKRRDARTPKKRKRDVAEAERQAKPGQKRVKKQKDETNGLLSPKKSNVIPDSTAEDVKSEASALQPVARSHETTADGPVANQGKQDDIQATGWTVSRPLGGRISDIDPILTEDERYLILAYSTSIQVYTTADSLLLRRIPITPNHNDPFRIVATKLSTQSSNLLWVACSDGRIWSIDWTTGSAQGDPVVTKSQNIVAMTILPLRMKGADHDTLVVSEHSSSMNGRNLIVAYEGQANGDKREANTLVSMAQSGEKIHSIHLVEGTNVLLAAANSTLIVGLPDSRKVSNFADLTYTFYHFETNDVITALDSRVSATIRPNQQSRRAMKGASKARDATFPIVDVLVGGARGPVYFYNDLVAKLQALEGSAPSQDALVGQKFHWHRRAVHSVKWSRDGNYMISGGSEHTLVIRQMDTSKLSFLPHLPGVISNIVVSPSGSSYAVHLDDNSVMVLSTAELEPTVYVSGVQSVTRNPQPPKDQWVKRVWKPSDPPTAVPAVLRPDMPGRLYLCVGSGDQATTSSGTPSAPYLQSVDLESFRSITKQAIARTHPSDAIITSQGQPITDPRVSHLAFSHDGQWLATVDEWTPPKDDTLGLGEDQESVLTRERREIHLKFWEVGTDENNTDVFSLVSRINAPHVTSIPETVFGLASDPASPRFATIGNDGVVRIWRPKGRQQDGVPATDANGKVLQTWTCSQMIALNDQLSIESINGPNAVKNQASLAFSEDGSALLVAFGTADEGRVYVIDTRSGDVKNVLDGLWTGTLRGIHVLSPYIIILSDVLKVHDVVTDELCYGMALSFGKHNPADDAVHFGVDSMTRHFAVAIPVPLGTELAVFSPETPSPVLLKRIPGRVLSLATSPSSSGFLILDDSAQLRTIAEGTDTDAVAIAQPLEDLRLEGVEAEGHEDGKDLMEMDDASDDEEDEEESDEDGMDVDSEDEEAYPAVVNQQRLAAIFDAAPAFAMPAIEDVFYKVAGLLATKKDVPVST
ncbi:related to small nucleolar ribonucleoprotein [Cephalotrichum gorgonifer]|uniref:Related to small nucleolar ribonucleoprotein n=1 Tax=Cephalotrichum gorgonifer TaxID=2041049 RepID=A0AAE8SV41_9PEZI|nr:related to small nucleolar ribonucleoprotein [Cephalotrichum gorgonifer]